MAQLCLWTKIRTKQLLGLGALAFQCMRAGGFMCLKCENIACLHIRQDQNELHLKRWFYFAKIGIFYKSIAGTLASVVQAYTQAYSCGERIKRIICQIRHEKKNVRWQTQATLNLDGAQRIQVPKSRRLYTSLWIPKLDRPIMVYIKRVHYIGF